jgi:hypothetical protein
LQPEKPAADEPNGRDQLLDGHQQYRIFAEQ